MKFIKLAKLGMCAALMGLLYGTSASVVRAGFDTGWQAYQRGDFSAALEEWQPLAEAGDSRAIFNLGTMYDEGKGVVRD